MTMNKRGRQWQEQCSFALWTAAFQKIHLDTTEHWADCKAKRRGRSILRCRERSEQKKKAFPDGGGQVQAPKALVANMPLPE
jgi:hypothetical protein